MVRKKARFPRPFGRYALGGGRADWVDRHKGEAAEGKGRLRNGCPPVFPHNRPTVVQRRKQLSCPRAAVAMNADSMRTRVDDVDYLLSFEGTTSQALPDLLQAADLGGRVGVKILTATSSRSRSRKVV